MIQKYEFLIYCFVRELTKKKVRIKTFVGLNIVVSLTVCYDQTNIEKYFVLFDWEKKVNGIFRYRQYKI